MAFRIVYGGYMYVSEELAQDMGHPRQVNNWVLLKVIFFNLIWPRTGLEKSL
jgi:hypothetical protein